MKQHKDKKKIFVSIFIIFIMVSSTLGFILGFSSNDSINQQAEEYNGFEFTQHDSGRWLTNIGNNPVALINYPGEIENIPFPAFLSLNELNSANKVYISYDHNKSIDQVLTEFQFLSPYVNKPLIDACTTEIEGCSNKPIKTCDDASQTEKVIQLNIESKEDKIIYNNNCIYLEGENLLKTVDRLIWTLLGVMR